MKKLILNFSCLGLIAACSPTADKESQQALGNYTHFVDSIQNLNDGWNSGIDSTFVEVPTDPNDPSKIRIDTIVTTPENRTPDKRFFPMLKETLNKEYEPLKAAVETNLKKMDEKMKKEYEAAKLKYEAMQAAE